MKKSAALISMLFIFQSCMNDQNTQEEVLNVREFDIHDTWISELKEKAPEKLSFPSSKTHKILVFSLHTGFNHWVIPHTDAMLKTITEKAGGFDLTFTKDIAYFEKDALNDYDAVVLNNNCSIGDKRDLFWDVLKNNESLDSAEALKKAHDLEKNLIDFVENGGGLMALHGGIVMQNKSMAFSEMMGGSFEYHPKQQTINVKLSDAAHPLLQAFNGEGFSHKDEPYIFNKAYANKNFKPLLYFDASEIEELRNPDGDAKRYISWIKSHGKGRVFYASPSHNAQSFNTSLMTFFLDGLQFIVGDVACNMSPMAN